MTVNEDGSTVPTIWIDNEPHDLNGLIAPDDPLRRYVFTSADRVNNRGQIVASGVDPRHRFSHHRTAHTQEPLTMNAATSTAGIPPKAIRDVTQARAGRGQRRSTGVSMHPRLCVPAFERRCWMV